MKQKELINVLDKYKTAVVCILLILILTSFIFLTNFFKESVAIDKSDCSWTTCNGEDIQHCDWNEYLTAEHCCDGCSCSDTYYTEDDNKCHLTLCENNPFGKDCTYEARK